MHFQRRQLRVAGDAPRGAVLRCRGVPASGDFAVVRGRDVAFQVEAPAAAVDHAARAGARGHGFAGDGVGDVFEQPGGGLRCVGGDGGQGSRVLGGVHVAEFEEAGSCAEEVRGEDFVVEVGCDGRYEWWGGAGWD